MPVSGYHHSPGARRWNLVGPNSSGAYVLQYHEGRVYHVYGGDVAPDMPGVVEEGVGAFLMRGGDPAGAADTREAADGIRRLLDGWYLMAYADRICTARGEPVAIDTPNRLLGPRPRRPSLHARVRARRPERESLVEEAERFAGSKLAISAWDSVDDEGCVYTSRNRASVRLA